MRVGAPLIQQIFPLFPNVWEVWATAFRPKFFLFYLIDCLVYSFLHFKSILRAKESRLTLLIGLIEFLCCPTEQNSLMLLFVISCKVTLSTLAAYTPGFFFIFFNFNVICMKLLEHKLDWANHMRKWLVMPDLWNLFRIESVEQSWAARARGQIQSFGYLLASRDDFWLLFYLRLLKHLAF